MKRFIINNTSDDVVEIYLLDVIGNYPYTSKEVITAIKESGKNSVRLYINSPGGDVFEGLGIYNYLIASGKKVTVEIQGLCASIASVIAMAGRKIRMSKNSLFMIHNPTTFAYGEEKDLQKSSELLKVVKDQLISIYMTKTGITADKITDMMDSQTWLNADKAKEMGFIDEVIEAQKVAAYFNPKEYYPDLQGFIDAKEQIGRAHV